MAHQRNVEGLRSNAQKKSQKALQRANEAIRLLLKQGRPVTFTTVAEAGRVSLQYLYKNQILRERIECLRNQYQPQVTIRSRYKTTASDASKEAIIAAMRDQIKELRRENEMLRRQIEVAYGFVYQQCNSGSAAK